MNSLIKVNGLLNVEGMKFHDIEGGFGEGKKAMSVKDIANIHNQPFGEINRRINDNIMRFTTDVDIVDIKANGFEPLGSKLGFSKQSFNQTKNIYVLSERGYAKLLKILEDDVAWEQYDKLVDGYFNMRGQAKLLSTEELLELQFKYTKEVKEQVESLGNDVAILKERMTIETGAQKVLQDLVNKKVITALGGKGSPAYTELKGKAFSQCWKNFKDILQVASYKDTPVKDFDLAKKVIIDWQPNRELELMIRGCNAQMRM